MIYSDEARKVAICWMIVAEGTIGFWVVHRGPNRRLQMRPRIRVTNTEAELLREFGRLCCMGSLSTHRPGNAEKNQKILYNWEILGVKSVGSLLRQVIDYFPPSRKKGTAQLVLDFCNLRTETLRQNHSSGYTEQEIAIAAATKARNGGIRRRIGTEVK